MRENLTVILQDAASSIVCLYSTYQFIYIVIILQIRPPSKRWGRGMGTNLQTSTRMRVRMRGRMRMRMRVCMRIRMRMRMRMRLRSCMRIP